VTVRIERPFRAARNRKTPAARPSQTKAGTWASKGHVLQRNIVLPQRTTEAKMRQKPRFTLVRFTHGEDGREKKEAAMSPRRP
jgi:hypothetical protein